MWIQIHKRASYKMLKKEGIIMNNDKIFLSADDVAEELNISKPFILESFVICLQTYKKFKFRIES